MSRLLTENGLRGLLKSRDLTADDLLRCLKSGELITSVDVLEPAKKGMEVPHDYWNGISRKQFENWLRGATHLPMPDSAFDKTEYQNFRLLSAAARTRKMGNSTSDLLKTLPKDAFDPRSYRGLKLAWHAARRESVRRIESFRKQLAEDDANGGIDESSGDFGDGSSENLVKAHSRSAIDLFWKSLNEMLQRWERKFTEAAGHFEPYATAEHLRRFDQNLSSLNGVKVGGNIVGAETKATAGRRPEDSQWRIIWKELAKRHLKNTKEDAADSFSKELAAKQAWEQLAHNYIPLISKEQNGLNKLAEEMEEFLKELGVPSPLKQDTIYRRLRLICDGTPIPRRNSRS